MSITDATFAHSVSKFPLPCDAVGFDRADGTFEPVLLLSSPLPRGGSTTRGIGAGSPLTVKVYRGTNKIAAKNHFLGEFAVSGFSNDDEKSQVQIGFSVDDKHDLSLYATDQREVKKYTVRRIDSVAKL